VSPESAENAITQYAAWMTLNCICRLEGIVHRIGLLCPSGVPLAGRVVPFAPKATGLREALLQGAKQIGIVPVEDAVKHEHVLLVGGEMPGIVEALHLYADAWCGGISRDVIPITSDSRLPFGAYLAASLAAAEVFKAARMKPEFHQPVSSVFYSTWHHLTADKPIEGGPASINVQIDAALAGVGAVGSGVVHALWACPGLSGKVILADNDSKGIDSTNLNRYALFGRTSIGEPKAHEAARIAKGTNIVWEPHDKGFEELEVNLPSLVISAVDRNASRIAIQQRYPPRILSGSTLDLRAEILRCGPPGVGACLRCYNPEVRRTPDDEIRGALRESSEERLRDIAAAAEIDVATVKDWVQTGRCGTAGQTLLSMLRESHSQHMFSVSFVSVFCATMLAGEILKECLGASWPLSDTLQRAVFQFRTPLARSNRANAYGRDPNCPMCGPDKPACEIWGKRFRALRQPRL